MRTIDAHQHFWTLARGDYGWMTPEFGPIHRDFGPEDLRPLLDAAAIDGTIVVQAAPSVAETEFALSIAERHEWILGVVGWVDMERSDAPETLARLAEHPKLVGIRAMIHDIPEEDWMLRPELEPVLSAMVALGLTFDALVRPEHLGPLLVLLNRHPDLACVIDHGAKPEIRSGQREPWAERMADIASGTNAICKFSGLVTEAAGSWTTDDIRPYADHLIEQFGATRLMFGSDWPVVTMAAGYPDWVSAARDLTAHLGEDDRAEIFGGTAARFYLKSEA